MALSLRVSGATYAQIGRALGVTGGRAKDLVEVAERRLEAARERDLIAARNHLWNLEWIARHIRKRMKKFSKVG